MHPEAPAYEGSETRTVLHERNPEVWRSESPIIRTADDKIVGKIVVYFRRGGDFLTLGIAHPSGVHCPQNLDSELTAKLFTIE